MPTCVPIEDLRDTAAFDELVETSPSPIVAMKNGYGRFGCVKSSDFSRWKQADARACLFKRIMAAERERAEGLYEDAFGASRGIREKRGL